MPSPPSLGMDCVKCRVAATCPSKGASPLLVKGKRTAVCQLIGGYGRVPVDPTILSAESLARSKRDGTCMTIAEVPKFEPGHGVIWETVFVFSPPVLHGREKTTELMDRVIPKNHNG